jgi:hypothetical protein
MNRLLMAGIISITLPFSGWLTVASNGTGTGTVVTQAQSPAAVNAVVGSNTSYNWAGYQATNGPFTAVSGTWTIPTVPSATSTEADATWVGIGGVSSQDLIQAGTQAVINGSGAPTYQAWYETLPQATTQVPLTVSPGDSISVSLLQTSAASGNTPAEWSVSLRDNTTGQSYQASLAYNSSLSSAEWIEEMPSDGTSFVPLDNFGSVSFSDGTATQNGVSETISGTGATELTMMNSAGSPLATPSPLGADGESFTVTRTSAPVTTFVGGSGSGHFIVGGRGGLGRGWRRTGVGIQGFVPQPTSTSTTGRGGNYGGTGAQWGQFYRILQQMQSLQQGFNTVFTRNGFREGLRMGR